MADASRVVEIVFNAVNNTGRGLSEISQGMDSAVKGIGNIAAPLSNVADKVLETEASVVALGVAFAGLAVNEASKFGEKMEEIGSLVSATPEQVNELKTAVQEFAGQSVSDFDKIGDAVYIATSNLGDTKKALDVMTVAEKGAIVGATDLETTTALLTRTMNAYGLVTADSAANTQNAERVMSAMFVTVQNGDVNMSALSDSIGKVASTAAAAGVSVEQVGASMAALTGAGINAEQSTTLLNAVIKELLAPSDALQEALGGLSITADGLPAVMEQLKKSTGGSADKMYEIFSSSEAAKAGLILANDSAGKFHTTLTAMGGATETFNTNYKNMTGGVADSTQILTNQIKILLQNIGDPLQESWAGVLDGMAKITSSVNFSLKDGAFDSIFAAINIFNESATKLFEDIARNLPEALNNVDFSQLMEALGEMGLQIGGLFDNVDLTTPEGLAQAIQFVVDSIESLTRVSQGIIAAWGPVVREIFDGVAAFNGLDESTKVAGGRLLGLAQIFDSLKGFLEGGTDALDKMATAMQVVAGSSAASTFTNIAAALGGIAPAAAGIGVAVAGTAAAVAGAAIAYDDYTKHSAAMAAADFETTKTLDGLKQKYIDISQQTGVNVTSANELQAAIKDGAIIFDAATQSYQNAGTYLQQISDSTGVTVKSTEDLNAALKSGSIVLDEATGKYTTYDKITAQVADSTARNQLINAGFAESVDRVAQSMDLASSKGESVISFYSDLSQAEIAAADAAKSGLDAFVRYEDGLYQVISTGEKAVTAHKDVQAAIEDTSKSNVRGSEEWKRTQDALQATTNAANEFALKAQEITEKRYEAVLTAVVDLKVAEIEAQVARVQAAFDSINVGIQSTGQTLVGLADIFANSGNLDSAKEEFLKKLVEEENARRETEFKLQEKLITQQVDYLKAKTERVKKGDALIKIDATPLAPELQTIFEKVLRLTQVKATEEGFDLLLGY